MKPADYEKLARRHPNANDPYEPYIGVGLLFNGDAYLRAPNAVPREEWEVVSPYEIKLIPVKENVNETS